MKTIKLTEDQITTLLHCLAYGECAASQKDYEDGTAKKRKEDIDNIREQLAKQSHA